MADAAAAGVVEAHLQHQLGPEPGKLVSRLADQRFGAPSPRSPVSSGRTISSSSWARRAVNPEQWPTPRRSRRPGTGRSSSSRRASPRRPPPADRDAVDGAAALDLDHPLALARQVGIVARLAITPSRVLQPASACRRSAVCVDQPHRVAHGRLEQRPPLRERRRAASGRPRRADRRRRTRPGVASASSRHAMPPGGSALERLEVLRSPSAPATPARRPARSGRAGSAARGSSGRAACRCATGGGARRRRTKTIARKPSSFGSYPHPSPSGSSRSVRASCGAMGGSSGVFTMAVLYTVGGRGAHRTTWAAAIAEGLESGSAQPLSV